MIKGRVAIDEFGDNVQSTNIPGDHWGGRHDQVKLLLYRLCLWAQEGLARVERQRQMQAMVPDFKFMLSIEGQSRPVLHELKVISCSKSRYKPSWTDRAVDRRAAALHQEYLDKARAADQQYGGVEPGLGQWRIS